MRTDDLGLIVTANGDGGDTLANQASWEFAKRWVGWGFGDERAPMAYASVDKSVITADVNVRPWKWTPARPQSAQQLLEKKPGLYVRNPDPSKWYSDTAVTSRDQLIPTLCALGMNKQYKELARLEWELLKRGFTAPNVKHNWGREGRKPFGDPFWGHITILFRAWGTPAVGALSIILGVAAFWISGGDPVPALTGLLFMWILDLTLLVGALIDAFKPLKADDSDDRNAINMHLAAVKWFSTPISYLARMIYSHTRPMGFGMLHPSIWKTVDENQAQWAKELPNRVNLAAYAGERHPVMAAWIWYCHRDYPELAEAYRPLILKHFPRPKNVKKNGDAGK